MELLDVGRELGSLSIQRLEAVLDIAQCKGQRNEDADNFRYDDSDRWAVWGRKQGTNNQGDNHVSNEQTGENPDLGFRVFPGST